MMALTTSTIGRYIDLVLYKTYADLKAEASRTYINYLWWVLDPLLSLGVYYIVFGILFQRGGEGFIFVLLVGLIFWRWYAESIGHAAGTIVNGKSLMAQMDMPKWIFPVVCLLTDITKFGFTLALLLIALMLGGYAPSLATLTLPLVMLVQLLLIAGCAMLAAALVPFIPDLRHVISTLLTLQMFVSGVFYTAERFLPHHRELFFLNPMARLINEYREILLHGHWPSFSGLGYVAVVGTLLLIFALWLIHKLDKVYPRLN